MGTTRNSDWNSYFLGLAGYHRGFDEGYSRIAMPLNQLTKKGQNFERIEKCENSFQEVYPTLLDTLWYFVMLLKWDYDVLLFKIEK